MWGFVLTPLWSLLHLHFTKVRKASKRNRTRREERGIFMSSNTMTSNTNAVAVRKLVINAMFIALTFLATMCVNIRLPIMANGGLIHLGNVPLFVGAILFGKKTGAIAGAMGMGLFDLISGWTAWAPFTFVVVGLIGFAVGSIMEKKESNLFAWYLLAMVVALGLKIGGYYIAEGIIFGNWVAPMASIPGNVMQIVTAAVISLPLAVTMKKALKL